MKNHTRGIFLAASLSMAATPALAADAAGYLNVMANGELKTERIESNSGDVCLAQAFVAAMTTENLEFAFINCVDADGEWIGSQTCTSSECGTIKAGEPMGRFPIRPS
ncbi:hypothetical protein FNJ84_21430 [Paracoccus sp. M683]|uniref:hypothetical protein n=1 Tax=Paracoccus sp. M683 TaxID=2594268 RepID=UPI001180FC6A|nr:hypothetical protein [Paracoccus sp. M683]TRW91949.1 hypothetical protein FNJ84_21430 [Paracoccus sp. M683]